MQHRAKRSPGSYPSPYAESTVTAKEEEGGEENYMGWEALRRIF